MGHMCRQNAAARQFKSQVIDNLGKEARIVRLQTLQIEKREISNPGQAVQGVHRSVQNGALEVQDIEAGEIGYILNVGVPELIAGEGKPPEPMEPSGYSVSVRRAE